MPWELLFPPKTNFCTSQHPAGTKLKVEPHVFLSYAQRHRLTIFTKARALNIHFCSIITVITQRPKKRPFGYSACNGRCRWPKPAAKASDKRSYLSLFQFHSPGTSVTWPLGALVGLKGPKLKLRLKPLKLHFSHPHSRSDPGRRRI